MPQYAVGILGRVFVRLRFQPAARYAARPARWAAPACTGFRSGGVAPACRADGAALLRMHGRGGEFVWRADGVGGEVPKAIMELGSRLLTIVGRMFASANFSQQACIVLLNDFGTQADKCVRGSGHYGPGHSIGFGGESVMEPHARRSGALVIHELGLAHARRLGGCSCDKWRDPWF